jgi:DNA helicase HerA-like ATPase
MGTVLQVGPTAARINLPWAARSCAESQHGADLPGGVVGECVVIECGCKAIFGRISEVRLPERERLTVEPELGRHIEAHPVGTVQLLSTVDVEGGTVTAGVAEYPRLGAAVFSLCPSLMRHIVEEAQNVGQTEPRLSLRLAELPGSEDAVVRLTPERLFGRHCAILGSTGGGKSWTVARIIEELCHFSPKIILIDPSGEFNTLGARVLHVTVGAGDDLPSGIRAVSWPYQQLSERDLFAIFTPGGQSQAHRLRAAIKSLKLAKADPSLLLDGRIVPKADRSKADYMKAERAHGDVLLDDMAEFEIKNLAPQIEEECVYPTALAAKQRDYTRWGGYNEQDRSYCATLMSRIESIRGSSHLAPVFKPGEMPPLKGEIDSFLANAAQAVLRVSLRNLSFEHHTREIVANAIGRDLLLRARNGECAKRPVLVIVDEAHQFLNKQLGEAENRYPLEAFGLIAKEGRKYGLTICIATQRPRDIPEDVLSQMGTLIVHRVTNDQDRQVVERASGDIDKAAAAFLPALGPGEAAVIGVDFPMPVHVHVLPPVAEPRSKGPDYQERWH